MAELPCDDWDYCLLGCKPKVWRSTPDFMSMRGLVDRNEVWHADPQHMNLVWHRNTQSWSFVQRLA
jgi:hypothetical protein